MYTDIKTMYLRPVYSTRSAYREATGADAPPHDPHRPLQFWEDPAPSRKLGVFALYDHALQKIDGRWRIAPLVVPLMWAQRINLPPDEGSLPGGSVSETIPPPLSRGLTEDEEIVEGPFGVVIRSRSQYVASLEEVDNFTAQDRALLRAIARKLGVMP